MGKLGSDKKYFEDHADIALCCTNRKSTDDQKYNKKTFSRFGIHFKMIALALVVCIFATLLPARVIVFAGGTETSVIIT